MLSNLLDPPYLNGPEEDQVDSKDWMDDYKDYLIDRAIAELDDENYADYADRYFGVNK